MGWQGQVGYIVRNYPQAQLAYEEVIKIDPRNSQGLACLGMIHHGLGEFDNAIARYHGVWLTTRVELLFTQVPTGASVIELLNLALKLTP